MAARPFVVPLARAPHASGGFSDLLAQGERRHVVLSFISPKYFKKSSFQHGRNVLVVFFCINRAYNP